MIKVSETLYEAIKNFLNFSPGVASHMENSENPHSVTKEQVGLGNVTNNEQATKTEFNSLKNMFLTHRSDDNNPHDVTKAQVGLGNADNTADADKPVSAATQAELAQKATKTEFNAHVAGTADKHSGDDVMYSQTKSVNEKINELIVEGGGGTMYHDELLNRDNADAHPIEAITGLRGQIGETLVFTGVTTDDTETIIYSDTESDYIDDYGCINFPKGKSAVAYITVVGYTPSNTGTVAFDRGGAFTGVKYIIGQADTTVTSHVYGDSLTAIYMNDTNTEAKLALSVSAVYGRKRPVLTVKGLADTTMYWRAEVKLTNVVTIGN